MPKLDPKLEANLDLGHLVAMTIEKDYAKDEDQQVQCLIDFQPVININPNALIMNSVIHLTEVHLIQFQFHFSSLAKFIHSHSKSLHAQSRMTTPFILD